MSDERYVGGNIFSKIESHPGVIRDLAVCLFCRVSQHRSPQNATTYTEIDYNIPLDCIKGNEIKQCPACKTIYILKDPTE